MRQFTMTVMALVAFGALVATAQAENTSVSRTARAAESASTCTGLKSVCMGYPYGLYDARSAQNWVPDTSYTREYFELYRYGLKRAQPYLEKYCNFTWEQCMKTGFWEGYNLHRSAERR
jgi:hypothetical protein